MKTTADDPVMIEAGNFRETLLSRATELLDGGADVAAGGLLALERRVYNATNAYALFVLDPSADEGEGDAAPPPKKNKGGRPRKEKAAALTQGDAPAAAESPPAAAPAAAAPAAAAPVAPPEVANAKAP
jgi:hypothetical protein